MPPQLRLSCEWLDRLTALQPRRPAPILQPYLLNGRDTRRPRARVAVTALDVAANDSAADVALVDVAALATAARAASARVFASNEEW